MAFQLPADWNEVLAEELEQPYVHRLKAFLESERTRHTVHPPEEELFSALRLTPYKQVKVLLLGQDPYHNPGQAHGLSFSVRPGVPLPPSLKNIFKELEDDLGVKPPGHGHLAHWARQGVLMLNTVLTVREHQPHSHRNQGWETFTDAIIRSVNDHEKPVVFLLWGNHAKKKKKWIDPQRHTVIESAHPSPLSAKRGFFGSRPFSAINRALREAGREEIDWRIPGE
ncbi:uracil-DNA glycosylase [Melghirimyces profundicolus]|uniref:Uracil-DNA glycosylase n=1 Tax=Melghirimyces profundicolus TaxID=1242148 RepID=A0A2T6C8A6_9BACL|nr:uracil-DNA glycosylase [Melghirimyces profundicolus]PTX64547.1 uracil-DNA glycosylase [Melghirimyces profundicolus]